MVVAVVVYAFLGRLSAGGFILGAVLSGAAGFIGMNISVRANVRTAEAARTSLQNGLTVAFRAGAVTGLLVAGLALLAIAVLFYVLTDVMGYAANDRAGGRPRSPPSRSARRWSRSSPVSAAASSPRPPTSAPTWSARSRPEFPRTIPATRP